MKSSVVKRSMVLAGHKTSVSLEDAFWEGLKDIAKAQRRTCLIWLAASILTANKVISRRPYGCSSSIITRNAPRLTRSLKPSPDP
jgi:predicted DNA-binding ribbon-helix-helix protein